jgi:hypothetical protein
LLLVNFRNFPQEKGTIRIVGILASEGGRCIGVFSSIIIDRDLYECISINIVLECIDYSNTSAAGPRAIAGLIDAIRAREKGRESFILNWMRIE